MVKEHGLWKYINGIAIELVDKDIKAWDVRDKEVDLLIALSYSVLTRDNTSMFDTFNPQKMRGILLVNGTTRIDDINWQFCTRSIIIFVTGWEDILECINCMKTLSDQLKMGNTVIKSSLFVNYMKTFLLTNMRC